MDLYNKASGLGQSLPEKPAGRPQVSMPPSSTSAGVGSIIGAIIIIILLAAGAFYFWGAKLNGGDTNPPPLILGNEAADAPSDATAGLPAQQTSDDTAAINADIQAMNIDALSAQTASSLEAYEAATQ